MLGIVIAKFNYFTRGGVEECEDISDKAKSRIPDEIIEVVSWHDMIASLPEMDDGWSWQIEFGLDPVCLYQVRPFRPLGKADFVIADQTDLHLGELVSEISEQFTGFGSGHPTAAGFNGSGQVIEFKKALLDKIKEKFNQFFLVYEDLTKTRE